MARAKIAPALTALVAHMQPRGVTVAMVYGKAAARELRAMEAVVRAAQAAHDEMAFGVNDRVDRALARLRRVSGGAARRSSSGER